MWTCCCYWYIKWYLSFRFVFVNKHNTFHILIRWWFSSSSLSFVHLYIYIYIYIIGVGLTGHRMIIKGHRLWDSQRGSRGCLRPKPVDCLLFMLTVFNACELDRYEPILFNNISPFLFLAEIKRYQIVYVYYFYEY